MDNNPTPCFEELQQSVRNCSSLLKQNWKGSLRFKLSPSKIHQPTEPYRVEDICNYLNGQSSYKRLYFCNQDYPSVVVPQNKPNTAYYSNNQLVMNKESFADLKKVIVTAAANSGQSLFCNGGIGHKQFECSAVVNRANSKKEKITSENAFG